MKKTGESDPLGGIPEASLNAYIDGEMDERQRLDMQQELSSDPVSSRYIEDIESLQRQLRSALHAVARRPPSDGLERTLHRMKTAGNAARRPLFIWRQPVLAMAAGLALLGIGFGAGLFSANQQFDRRISALEDGRNRALDEVGLVLNRVLEHSPSGQAVAWRSDRHDASAELTPIRTLKTPDQRYCREYRETLVINGEREERRGLSCRTGKEQWEKLLLIPSEAKALF